MNLLIIILLFIISLPLFIYFCLFLSISLFISRSLSSYQVECSEARRAVGAPRASTSCRLFGQRSEISFHFISLWGSGKGPGRALLAIVESWLTAWPRRRLPCRTHEMFESNFHINCYDFSSFLQELLENRLGFSLTFH